MLSPRKQILYLFSVTVVFPSENAEKDADEIDTSSAQNAGIQYSEYL